MRTNSLELLLKVIHPVHTEEVTDSATAESPRIDVRRHDAVIFDMDGVVTDTATVHAAAWTELFNAFLAAVPADGGHDLSPFTEADYLRYVDGKPRHHGVADFLAARGIELPWGDSTDPDTAETVCGLGKRKDRLFQERITRDGVSVFTSTVALIRRLRSEGIRTAVFSASRNCAQVLAAAGIAGLFSVRVDGVDAAELGLAGKPDPAMLIEVARRLHADPERVVVVEDAEAGVAAGRNGGFALVIGIDRGAHADRLLAAGADIVVDDAARIRLLGGLRRVAEVADVFERWPAFSDLLDAQKAAVLLDFDGTLAEIVTDPAAARPVEGVEITLAELAAECPVAVISGRDLDDLCERLPVRGVWLAGSHGFELMAPDGTRHVHDAAPGVEQELAEAAGELRDRLEGIPGVLVEHKRFAVAVHYRTVSEEAVSRVSTAVHDVGRERGLRITAGRKIVELRPDVDWDKGAALRWILERLSAPALPIYLGDDMTDEDAFDVVETNGLGIVVRDDENADRFTAARFSVTGVHRVRDLLERTMRLLRDSGADTWSLTFEGYDPAQEKLREALCTVGNGYFATRGAAPECRAGQYHYPGTYVAGVYNRLQDRVAGQTIDNESLVNLPNWLPVTFRIDDGDPFDLDTAELLEYRQRLDIRRAELIRRFRVRDAVGRTTRVTQRRFAAMHRPHLGALETTITAENWSGRLRIRSTIDGTVRNGLVERYRDLSGTHLAEVRTAVSSAESVQVAAQTSGSRIPVAVATRNILRRNGKPIETARETVRGDGLIGHEFDVEVRAGDSVVLEKMVGVFTGRDPASSGPEDEAVRWAAVTEDYAALLEGHVGAWDHLWARLHIDLDHNENAVRILRLHLLHLIQTVSPNTVELDVGVPARGLHGEAYRGHIFWDELFVFPVLGPRFSVLTRSLLRYRHRRLPEARRAAAEAGLEGAMFPWQSGSDGREESQRLHLNPLSGRWNPDPSSRAHHIGSAVAYAVWHYYQATGDLEFLAEYGAELLVEIARFWSGLADRDPRRDRYVICGVIGPDEFHSGYPQAPGSGVDNNAYTNIMAAWTILRALDALAVLPPRTRSELLEKLRVHPSEPPRWHEVAHRMYVPFHDGVISQFEGYDRLRELDWDHYRRRYGNIQRLDRILEAEGDDVNRYRAAKQADVLMLFYLFSADELRELLGRLDYELPAEMIPRTIDYYLSRTSHGSTLSILVHSWVLARANRDRAMEFFDLILDSDVADIQGGTTAEGIHLAAMAGSVDLLQRCFTGLEIRHDQLIFCPYWPKSLGALSFPMVYRGHRLTVRVSGEHVEVCSEPGGAPPIEVVCREQVARLSAGETVRMAGRPHS